MDDRRIRVGYKSSGALILPPHAKHVGHLTTHDLYKIKADTKVKGRVNLMAAQDDAALRYQILTGDVIR